MQKVRGKGNQPPEENMLEKAADVWEVLLLPGAMECQEEERSTKI